MNVRNTNISPGIRIEVPIYVAVRQTGGNRSTTDVGINNWGSNLNKGILGGDMRYDRFEAVKNKDRTGMWKCWSVNMELKSLFLM